MGRKILELLIVFFLAAAAPAMAGESLESCWHYSNTRATEDHQYGEEFYFWREGGAYGGVVIAICGATGSPARAEIENAAMEEGNVTFDFIYEYGVTYPEGIPVVHKGSFIGTMAGDIIEGEVTYSEDESCENGKNFEIVIEPGVCEDAALQKEILEQMQAQ